MSALLEVEGLSLRYGPVQALRGVSLRVDPGEVVGIVGESGSGKSSLVAAIAGLLTPEARVTGGTIRLGGADLAADSPAARRARLGRDLALVFQDPMRAFSPVLTLGAQLVDFQHHDRATPEIKWARAAQMLARVGIGDPARRLGGHVHTLSGGMRQRAAIAAALLAQPRVLIADEPTTALDVTTEAQILDLLRDLRSDLNGGIVIVTHHLGVVAQLASRVVVMYAGEVVEEAPVDALFHAPAHPYTRALLDCDPGQGSDRLDVLPTIPGEPPDLAPPPPGCAFAARCARAEPRCAVPQPLRDLGAARRARCWAAA